VENSIPMNLSRFRKRINQAALLVSLILLDQLSKYLIRSKGGFYICNSNISWGINIPNAIFHVFWLFLIGFIILLLIKKQSICNPFLLLVILSGAVSNMIDRLAYGCVIDFIDLKFWPVFNLADVFIFFGAVLLLVRWNKL
jgi:signal peptidase II